MPLLVSSEWRSQRPDPTKSRASLARLNHFSLVTGAMATHSFISRPWPGSKCCPSPDATKASTRSFGSFTTSFPLTSMANTLPPIFRPSEPNIFDLLTPASLSSCVITASNNLSAAAPDEELVPHRGDAGFRSVRAFMVFNLCLFHLEFISAVPRPSRYNFSCLQRHPRWLYRAYSSS